MRVCRIYLDTLSLTTASVDRPVVKRKIDKYTTKKTFADRLSKPFTNLKFAMPKAFQTHTIADTTVPTASSIPMPLTTSKIINDKKTNDTHDSIGSLRKLQNDIEYFKELLNRKEQHIQELTRTTNEERIKFEKDMQKLHRYIEHLTDENLQLKTQLNYH
jgi:septal ring factor EnvC (AmiA/AmiB activator)